MILVFTGFLEKTTLTKLRNDFYLLPKGRKQ